MMNSPHTLSRSPRAHLRARGGLGGDLRDVSAGHAEVEHLEPVELDADLESPGACTGGGVGEWKEGGMRS